MNRETLILFTRFPVAGRAKTRRLRDDRESVLLADSQFATVVIGGVLSSTFLPFVLLYDWVEGKPKRTSEEPVIANA